MLCRKIRKNRQKSMLPPRLKSNLRTPKINELAKEEHGADCCVLERPAMRAGRLTQSPELGFGFCLFSSWNGFAFGLALFVFTRLRPPSFGCCCATVRTLLRSPTSDAAAPPAFLQWRRSPASSRFFPHARPLSGPSAGVAVHAERS